MEDQLKTPVDEETRGCYIQAAIFLQETGDFPYFSVDPWDNCPSTVAREEGRACDECEYWGREVEAVDWIELSRCCFVQEHPV